MLRVAVAANIRKCFPHNPGDLAASSRRQADLWRITNELRPDPGILPVACDHAGEELHDVARVELERLELMNEVAEVGSFVLHELLHLEEFLLTFRRRGACP